MMFVTVTAPDPGTAPCDRDRVPAVRADDRRTPDQPEQTVPVGLAVGSAMTRARSSGDRTVAD